MIFNGITKDYVRVLRGRDRPFWANRTHNIDERNRVRKTSTDPRIITVPILIMHDGFSDLQRKKEDIANWLVHDEVKTLKFIDDPNRHYHALVDGILDHEEASYWADGEITFVCPMPFKLGETKPINLTTTNQTFNITGQVETPWTSRTVFTESASQFKIESSNGLNIILNYGFIKGHVLEIDYNTRDVFLKGNDLSVAIDLRTEWFELPVGNVVLKASHPTEVTYTERYY